MRAAVAFLTPLGGARTPTPRSLRWFPVVGAALGASVGLVWWAASRAWVPPLSAAVALGADLALTGMLHFDGLVDSADGLLPHLDRQRRLDVMSEPATGAFGFGIGAAVLLLRYGAFVALTPAPLLLASLWAASRTAMAVAATHLPYARSEGGLASAFTGGTVPPGIVVLSAAACAVGAVAWSPLAGAAALAAAVVSFRAVVRLAEGRIGGFTGDVLGAAGMVAETAGVVVAAARW